MNLNIILEESARANAARTALIFTGPDGQERFWTYAALHERTRRAAGAFRARGIGRGDRVAIIHRNDPAFLVAYFGLLRLGAVAVPINFMIQNPEELRFMLAHSGAKGVVTQDDFLPGILGAKRGLPDPFSVWTTDDARVEAASPFWPWVEGAEPEPAAAPCEPGDAVAILYTSGTTGDPKGVLMTHRNLASNARATIATLGLCRDDCFLALLPMFHTFCWMVDVVVPLSLGATVVVTGAVAPPKPWLRAVGRHGVSVLAAVPPVWTLLADNDGLLELIRAEKLFRRLRICVSGAAPLAPRVLEAIRARYGLEITEGYGLTETSPVATLNPPGATRPGSVGRPIAGVELRIAAEGEIEIRGPNVMKGYYRDPSATREAISDEGWFKSGDIGVFDDDGYLHLRDRKKDMIIVKGLKVFSAQVERALLGHPAVREAAVIGVPGAEGEERIKAFLVLKEGATAGVCELHRFCRENLDGYKRPREIELVGELPKNALNKTLKRVLREREAAKAAPAISPA